MTVVTKMTTIYHKCQIYLKFALLLQWFVSLEWFYRLEHYYFIIDIWLEQLTTQNSFFSIIENQMLKNIFLIYHVFKKD